MTELLSRFFRRSAPAPPPPSAVLDLAAMEAAVRAKLDVALHTGTLVTRPRRTGSYFIAAGMLDRAIKDYLTATNASHLFSTALLRDFKHWIALGSPSLPPGTAVKGVRNAFDGSGSTATEEDR